MDPMLLINLLTMLLVGLIGVLVGGIGWYLRKYVISEVEKNAAARRFLFGENIEESEGHITHIDEQFANLEREMRSDHEEVREVLLYMSEWLRNISEAIRDRHGEPVERPDDPPDAFGYRGSAGEEPAND